MSPDTHLQEVIERQLYGLLTAGLPIAVFNLRRIRNFACATGWLAETASLNAVLIAPVDYSRRIPSIA